MTRTPSAVALALLTGCAAHAHLQYDQGRCFEQSLAIQADLDRSTAVGQDYPLTGVEGLELRARATEEATDTESGQAEYIDTFEVE